MQRYFLKESYGSKDYFVLEGEDYHRIVQAVRMELEDETFLAFSNQIAIVAGIMEIAGEAVYLKEIKKEENQRELSSSIIIASGYPKGERLDWIAQEFTELGVQAFLDFPASASVVRWDAKKRMKRRQWLEEITQETTRRSHRQTASSVELLEMKQDLFKRLDDYDVVLVTYEESAKQGEGSNVAEILNKTKPDSWILTVFGPEDGLSCDEIGYFIEHEGILCGLGPRILRMGTVLLHLLSAVSYQWELMNPSFS